mgnify:CR=1 FL=1|tara:strand:- start:486 stop:773 length:288 start_codon:yes stop_codon:yes gene_type:complete
MAEPLASGISGAFGPRITDNEKLLMGLPSRSDYDTLAQLHSSRFNTLDTSMETMQSQLNDLTAYIVNLKLNLTSHITDFTGHTGVPAITGHGSLT